MSTKILKSWSNEEVFFLIDIWSRHIETMTEQPSRGPRCNKYKAMIMEYNRVRNKNWTKRSGVQIIKKVLDLKKRWRKLNSCKEEHEIQWVFYKKIGEFLPAFTEILRPAKSRPPKKGVLSGRMKLTKAIIAIRKGMTFKEACERFNVKEEVLKKKYNKSNNREKEKLKSQEPGPSPIKKKLKGKSKCKPSTSNEEIKKLCEFCHHPEEREIELGKFHVMKTLSVHYYCLLFSCALEQNGEDDEGILGFLQKDITREVARGKKLKCIYCQKTGATIGCSHSKCKTSYHFPCGLDHHAQFLFMGDFSSYCELHRSNQNGTNKGKMVECPICMEVMKADPKHAIYPPCCKRGSWFHKICLQKLAISAGYFFKCPLCNDAQTFVQEMRKLGVHVPEQDASWELEPNAYQELLERPLHCNARRCLCEKGRKHDDEGSKFEIILCNLCGATGRHISCAGLSLDSTHWECSECIDMLKRSKKAKKEEEAAVTSSPTKSEPQTPIAISSDVVPSTSSQSLITPSMSSVSVASVSEVRAFASNLPGILTDHCSSAWLNGLVASKLDLLDKTLTKFANISLNMLQMSLLFEIYQPLCAWLKLRKVHGNDRDKMSHMSFKRMQTLGSLIVGKVEEANKSPLMSSIKEEYAALAENTCSRIRYGPLHQITYCPPYPTLKPCYVSIARKYYPGVATMLKAYQRKSGGSLQSNYPMDPLSNSRRHSFNPKLTMNCRPIWQLFQKMSKNNGYVKVNRPCDKSLFIQPHIDMVFNPIRNSTQSYKSEPDLISSSHTTIYSNLVNTLGKRANLPVDENSRETSEHSSPNHAVYKPVNVDQSTPSAISLLNTKHTAVDCLITSHVLVPVSVNTERTQRKDMRIGEVATPDHKKSMSPLSLKNFTRSKTTKNSTGHKQSMSPLSPKNNKNTTPTKRCRNQSHSAKKAQIHKDEHKYKQLSLDKFFRVKRTDENSLV